MKFHHLLTVTGLFYYSFRIHQQFYIIFSLGMTEITNPFLQARWFLKYHGQREGIIFKMVETILIAMFFVIRVFMITYYAYIAFTREEHGFERDDIIFTTLGCLTGYALAIQMFNYIRYQLKKSRKKKET
jgi:TLC domain